MARGRPNIPEARRNLNYPRHMSSCRSHRIALRGNLARTGNVLFGPVEPAFNIKRFRPVRKSNIDIFKKMLEPASNALVGA